MNGPGYLKSQLVNGETFELVGGAISIVLQGESNFANVLYLARSRYNAVLDLKRYSALPRPLIYGKDLCPVIRMDGGTTVPMN